MHTRHRRNAKIRSLHAEGTPIADIARKYGITVRRVYAILQARPLNGKTVSEAINECGGRDARGN